MTLEEKYEHAMETLRKISAQGTRGTFASPKYDDQWGEEGWEGFEEGLELQANTAKAALAKLLLR